MVKKVMITGASGLLGRAIHREFSADQSWQTLGLAFSRAGGGLKQVDLRDKEAVNAVIHEFEVLLEDFEGLQPMFPPCL